MHPSVIHGSEESTDDGKPLVYLQARSSTWTGETKTLLRLLVHAGVHSTSKLSGEVVLIKRLPVDDGSGTSNQGLVL